MQTPLAIFPLYDEVETLLLLWETDHVTAVARRAHEQFLYNFEAAHDAYALWRMEPYIDVIEQVPEFDDYSESDIEDDGNDFANLDNIHKERVYELIDVCFPFHEMRDRNLEFLLGFFARRVYPISGVCSGMNPYWKNHKFESNMCYCYRCLGFDYSDEILDFTDDEYDAFFVLNNFEANHLNLLIAGRELQPICHYIRNFCYRDLKSPGNEALLSTFCYDKFFKFMDFVTPYMSFDNKPSYSKQLCFEIENFDKSKLKYHVDTRYILKHLRRRVTNILRHKQPSIEQSLIALDTYRELLRDSADHNKVAVPKGLFDMFGSLKVGVDGDTIGLFTKFFELFKKFGDSPTINVNHNVPIVSDIKNFVSEHFADRTKFRLFMAIFNCVLIVGEYSLTSKLCKYVRIACNLYITLTCEDMFVKYLGCFMNFVDGLVIVYQSINVDNEIYVKGYVDEFSKIIQLGLTSFYGISYLRDPDSSIKWTLRDIGQSDRIVKSLTGSVEVLLTLIGRLFEYIGVRFNYLGDDLLHPDSVKLRRCVEQAESIIDYHRQPDAIYNAAMSEQVLVLNRTLLHMYSTMPCLPEKSQVRMVINNLIKTLNPITVKYESLSRSNSGIRPKTVGLAFIGPPGVGKTYSFKFLSRAVLVNTMPQYRLNMCIDNLDNEVWPIVLGRNFHNNYNNQWVSQIDDFGCFLDQAGTDLNGIADILRMIGDAPYPLDRAGIDEKDNTFFRSRLITLTTNMTVVSRATVKNMVCPDALARRFKCFMYYVNDSYALNPKETRWMERKINLSLIPDDCSMDKLDDIYSLIPWDWLAGTPISGTEKFKFSDVIKLTCKLVAESETEWETNTFNLTKLTFQSLEQRYKLDSISPVKLYPTITLSDLEKSRKYGDNLPNIVEVSDDAHVMVEVDDSSIIKTYPTQAYTYHEHNIYECESCSSPTTVPIDEDYWMNQFPWNYIFSWSDYWSVLRRCYMVSTCFWWFSYFTGFIVNTPLTIAFSLLFNSIIVGLYGWRLYFGLPRFYSCPDIKLSDKVKMSLSESIYAVRRYFDGQPFLLWFIGISGSIGTLWFVWENFIKHNEPDIEVKSSELKEHKSNLKNKTYNTWAGRQKMYFMSSVPKEPAATRFTESTSTVMNSIVRKNIYRVWLIEEGKCDLPLQYVLQIKGRSIIGTSHLIRALERRNSVDNKFSLALQRISNKQWYPFLYEDIRENICMVDPKDDTDILSSDRDYFFCHVPKLQPVKSIVDKFASSNNSLLRSVFSGGVVSIKRNSDNTTEGTPSFISGEFTFTGTISLKFSRAQCSVRPDLTIPESFLNAFTYRSRITIMDGDCGSIALTSDTINPDCEIFGLLIGGDSTYSYYTQIFREDVEQYLLIADDRFKEFDVEENLSSAIADCKIQLMEPQFLVCGTGYYNTSMKSEHKRTEAYDGIPDYEITQGISKSWSLPMWDIARSGYGSNIPLINTKLWYDITDLQINNTLSLKSYREPVIYDYNQAVAGVPGLFDSIGRDKSSGYPYCMQRITRKDIFGVGDEYNLTTSLSIKLNDDVQSLISKLQCGVLPEIVVMDQLKSETLPLEKVDKKCRMFFVFPLHYVIACRMYLMDLNLYMKDTCIINGNTIGISPYNDNWKVLVEFLRSYSDHIVAGDYSAWDKKFFQEMLISYKRLALTFYINKGSSTLRVIDGLITLLERSFHLGKTGDGSCYYYLMTMAMLSGVFITADANSFGNQICIRYVIADILMNNNSLYYDRFNFNVTIVFESSCCVCNGDDNLIAIRDEYVDIINQLTLQSAFFRVLGLSYTDETKSGIIHTVRSLILCNFLKRGFRYERSVGKWVAPLALPSIFERIYFSRRTATHDNLLQNAQSALMELSAHGEDVFAYWQPRLLLCFRIYNILPGIVSYGACLALYLQCEDKYER